MIDINSYQRDGYVVIKDFVSHHDCNRLIQRANELIHECWSEEFKMVFSTLEQSHAKHQYFLESGDKIRLFFEEGAFDATGQLNFEKEKCINKIGHALHKLDDTFVSFSYSSALIALANQLSILNPCILQSMYIYKQPFIGGEVTCHQDSTYLFVKNKPVTGCWFALEDATLENGCLWAIPGGHHTPLKSRMIRDQDDQIRFETYDSSPWPLDQMVPLEVPKGTLIVLHGLLPHMSKVNTSGKSRHAYTVHLMSSHDDYAADNWLRY